MCGIAGIISQDPQKEEFVRAMAKALEHRGPDDSGFYFSSQAHVSLGHTRLSIIDLKSGGQPMYSADKSLVVVFNGEIYNYKDLMAMLEKRGYVFQTHSDTEVLLHLYKEFGSEMLSYLNGMFAFAIYDAVQDLVFMARDRVGVKPFFYFFDGNTFAFASEIEALRKVPQIHAQLEIDEEALWHYFSLLYIPAPRTIYKQIQHLPSGYCATFSKGEFKLQQYWKPEIKPNTEKSLEENVDTFLDLLRSSLVLRMQSDVPYGAYLSGGVDSSLVVALMSELSAVPIKTFTAQVRFDGLDEREYADAVAQKFHTDHTVFTIDKIDFDIVQKLLFHTGQPFADSSLLPTYLISKQIRDKVIVALGGEGPDELFSGYDKYKAVLGDNVSDEEVKQAFLNRVPLGLKETVCTKEFQDTFSYLKNHENNNNYHGHDLMRFLDVQFFLQGNNMQKLDTMSMASSIEAREPFLDYRIIEFALSLPKDQLVSKERNKILPKQALERYMPPEFVNRQKVGFVLPIADWISSYFSQTSKIEFFLESTAQFLKKEKMQEIINEYLAGKKEYGNFLFAYLVFCLWYHNIFKV